LGQPIHFNIQTGQMMLAGRGGNSRALIETDKNNWAPRIGFATPLQTAHRDPGRLWHSYYRINSAPAAHAEQQLSVHQPATDPRLAIASSPIRRSRSIRASRYRCSRCSRGFGSADGASTYSTRTTGMGDIILELC